MNTVVGVIVALTGGLTFLAGIFSTVIAWHSADPQLRRKLVPSAIVCIILAIILVGASCYSLFFASSTSNPSQQIASSSSPTPTLTPLPSTTTAPSSPTSTPTTASLAPPPDYSAAQPGPGCDPGKGIWTTQGLVQIQCGTTISSMTNSLGYLYLQLPNDAQFSPKNKISVMGGNLSYVTGSVCLGLAEQGSSVGILGEYCGDGEWFIYSLSSTGVIDQQIKTGTTSERQKEGISLTLQNSTVSFSIDTEIYTSSTTLTQPLKVAITSYNETPNNYNYIAITDFVYTPQPG